MIYYPVIIPTLNRYEHLKRCIESLARNTHANKTELIIGLDYPPSDIYKDGYNIIKNYLPTVSGFRKVTIMAQKSNVGAEKNYKQLLEYAYQEYDAVIFTEDDNEFSPCFLDFMNKALEKYKGDDRVSCVQGYNDDKFRSVKGPNVMFVYSGGAWGFGQWRDKQYMLDVDPLFSNRVLTSFHDSWKIFKTFPAIFNMLISMDKKKVIWGDVCICCQNVLNNRFQLKPRFSMVRNWGNDGTGIHCGDNPYYENQEIQTGSVFELDNVSVKLEINYKRIQFLSLLSDNKLIALCQALRILLRYANYRMELRKSMGSISNSLII